MILRLRLISLLFICIFLSNCNQDDEITEPRFFDKIVVTAGNFDNWDLLTGPDLIVSYGENSYDFQSDVIFDVRENDLPVQWTFGFDQEITDANWLFKIEDSDDLGDDQLMFQTNFQGLEKTKEGNPFLLSNSEWIIEIHWKTK